MRLTGMYRQSGWICQPDNRSDAELIARFTAFRPEADCRAESCAAKHKQFVQMRKSAQQQIMASLRKDSTPDPVEDLRNELLELLER